MDKMTVEQAVNACAGEFKGDRGFFDREITSLVTDSRKVIPGGVYGAIKGERVDGHGFIGSAFDAGAFLVVGEKDFDPKDNGIYVKVPSTVEAVGRIARDYMQMLDIPVVGITGSVGKTSTKEVIAAVLAQEYVTGKTLGNHNNEIGLPLTCCEMDSETEVAVLEMGISAPEEMDYLTGIVQPEVAVITNIGVTHMEILGSREGIFEEKSKIYKNIPKEGLVILNGDNDILSQVKDTPAGKPLFVGLEDKNDIYAEDIREEGLSGSSFIIKGLNCGDLEVHIPIPGRHMVTNALAAAAVGEYFGLSAGSIQKGIASVETVSGRTNIRQVNGITVIDDSYNASPVSMMSAIDTLCLADGRKICVLGNMYELGDDSLKMHRQVGEYAASKNVDVLFTCGDMAKEIAEGAKGRVGDIRCFDDNEALVKELEAVLREGDAVMIKASNSMKFGDVAKALMGDG